MASVMEGFRFCWVYKAEKQGGMHWGRLATESLDCWVILYRLHRKGNAHKGTVIVLKKIVDQSIGRLQGIGTKWTVKIRGKYIRDFYFKRGKLWQNSYCDYGYGSCGHWSRRGEPTMGEIVELASIGFLFGVFEKYSYVQLGGN